MLPWSDRRVTGKRSEPGSARPATLMSTPAASSRSQSLPSAIEICLSERLTPARAERLARDKRFIRELQDQALHDLEVFPYVDTLDCSDPLNPSDFILYASASMSPFTTEGRCACSSCRIRYADIFSRGVCLYADVVVLSDYFSGDVLNIPPEDWSPEVFALWVKLLGRLEPLMRGGVIRFSRWLYTRCSACRTVADRAIAQVADRLLEDIRRTVGSRIEWGSGGGGDIWPKGKPWVAVQSPVLTGAAGPQVLRMVPTKTIEQTLAQVERRRRQGATPSSAQTRRLRAFVDGRLTRELRSHVDAAVFAIAMASHCQGSVATDSELGARVLTHLDSIDQMAFRAANSWITPPTHDLPWVRDLDPSEVMQVRSDALSALPAFRAHIRSALFANAGKRRASRDRHLLQARIAEVEHELRYLRILKRRSRAVTLSGLAMAAWSLGTQDPAVIAAGLGGFLSTLAAGHSSSATREHREHALTHKPAYVLVQAKALAARRHRRHPRH